MSMTSAMAASSRTHSSPLTPTLGLPTGKWGSGQGALLEAQHLVKGPQEPEVAGLWFSCGGRAGAPMDLGPMGGKGRPGYTKSIRALSLAQGTSLWSPGQRLLKKQSSLRLGQASGAWPLGGLGEGPSGTRPFFVLPWALQGGVGASFTSPTVTRCFPISLGPGSPRF